MTNCVRTMQHIGVNGSDYMCNFCENEQPIFERMFRSELTGPIKLSLFIDRKINCMIAQMPNYVGVVYIEYCPKCGRKINPPKVELKRSIDEIFPE